MELQRIKGGESCARALGRRPAKRDQQGSQKHASAHAGKSRDEPGSSPHGGCRAEPNRASVDRIRRLLEHHQRTGSNQQLACQNEIGMSAEHEQSAEESRQ